VLGVLLTSVACDIKVGENGLSVGVAAGRATDEWNRTYELQPGGELEIVNVNGQIQASPASGTQVEVRATREVRARTEDEAREILKKAEMREEVAPDRVVVRPPETGSAESGIRRPQIAIRYEIRVPQGLNLRLTTQNGEVRLEGIQGPQISVSSTNGGITGRGVSGAVDASTVNGGIQMELQAVTGDTRMVTVNGGVVLTLPSSVDADLEASAVNGGVLVQSGVPLTADERTGRRVAGRINDGGGPRIVVTTTNGGVRVGMRAPDAPSGAP
jgi:plasmid stability protein